MDHGGRLVTELSEALAVDSVDRLSGLVRVREQLDALIAVETAAFDGHAAFEDRAYRSPATFLTEESRVSGRAARGYLKAGRVMKAFPLLSEAAQSGRIPFDAVRAFTRIVANPRADDDRLALASEHEEQFLAKATAYKADDFAKLCKQWRGIADDNCPKAQARINETTDVSYFEHDDNETAELRIVGPKLDVLLVKNAMTRVADRLWREDRGETDDNVRPMRHARGRKFRAIVELAQRALANEGKDVVVPEPLLSITMDESTFQREAAAFAIEGPGLGPADVFNTKFESETTEGVPIAPRHAFRLGIVGRMRRIVFKSNSRKVDLGRTQRTFVGAARDAVMNRDKHCQAKGCDMPARWCDVDHIQEWQDGGTTTPENGELLCRYHHVGKHNQKEAA